MKEFLKDLFDSIVVKAWEGKLFAYNIHKNIIESKDFKSMLIGAISLVLILTPLRTPLILLDVFGATIHLTILVAKEAKRIIKKTSESKKQKEQSIQGIQEEHEKVKSIEEITKEPEKADNVQKEETLTRPMQYTYNQDQEPIVKSKPKVLVKTR